MSPTEPSTRGPRRAAAMPPGERRAAIIAAVRPLLVEHGERVTTRQIAAAAGIAEGTIFRVFADKDELIDTTLDSALDPAPLEEAIDAVDRSLPFEQQLVAVTTLIQRRVVDVWALVSSVGSKRAARFKRPISDSPALVARFRTHEGRLRVAPEDAAHLLRALTLSLTHPMLADRPTDAAEIVGTVLHGIARAAGEPGTGP